MVASNISKLKFYQAFRWWGIGTYRVRLIPSELFYQAFRWWGIGTEVWKGAGGELFYQAFRWWGIGTTTIIERF